MIIRKARDKRKSTDMHIRWSGTGTVKMSAQLRDQMPTRYIKVDIDGTKVTLIPSNDESDYKLSVSKVGQMEFAWSHVRNFIHIPMKTNISVSKNEDGSFSFEVPV